MTAAPHLTPIQQLLQRGLERAGSGRALAAALEMTEYNVSKLLRGKLPGAEAAIRLALLLDEPPASVLRAAQKPRFAELWERAAGPDARFTAADRELLERWRRLDAAQRRALTTIVKALPPVE